MLNISDLQIGFVEKKTTKILINQLSFKVEPGELCVILGRNGTGKTSLLRTIAGFQKALSGGLSILQVGQWENLQELSNEQLARLMSIVTTERVRLGYFTVEEVVALGRHPYTDYFGQLKKQDEQIIQQVIEQVGIQHLKRRPLAQLSDGEHQKTMIARALAQGTPLLLLDEPTAHLDIINRIEIFQLLKKLTLEKNKAILCSSHEVELALQFADKIILLDGKGNTYMGSPNELIEKGQIEQAYQGEAVQFDRKLKRFFSHQ